MSRIQDSIEVNAPLETVCDTWTRFEDFPRFMDGVDMVERVDARTLRWTSTREGLTGPWRALIVDQQPHERIAWAATGGAPTDVEVTFRSLGPDRTRVDLALYVEPEGVAEDVGGAGSLREARVTGDLERFRDFVESRGVGKGGWRGQSNGARVTGIAAGTTDDSSLAGLARPAAARRAATGPVAGIAEGMGTDLGAWETERVPAEEAVSDHPPGRGPGFATGQAGAPVNEPGSDVDVDAGHRA